MKTIKIRSSKQLRQLVENVGKLNESYDEALELLRRAANMVHSVTIQFEKMKKPRSTQLAKSIADDLDHLIGAVEYDARR